MSDLWLERRGCLHLLVRHSGKVHFPLIPAIGKKRPLVSSHLIPRSRGRPVHPCPGQTLEVSSPARHIVRRRCRPSSYSLSRRPSGVLRGLKGAVAWWIGFWLAKQAGWVRTQLSLIVSLLTGLRWQKKDPLALGGVILTFSMFI